METFATIWMGFMAFMFSVLAFNHAKMAWTWNRTIQKSRKSLTNDVAREVFDSVIGSIGDPPVGTQQAVISVAVAVLSWLAFAALIIEG